MKKQNQKASLKISQEVIETIAQVAALEVEGVAAIALKQSHSKKLSQRPIQIRISDGIAEISVALILDYRAKVKEVCEAVQKNIKENVQTMTGIMVAKINIDVEGICLPEIKEKAPDEQTKE